MIQLISIVILLGIIITIYLLYNSKNEEDVDKSHDLITTQDGLEDVVTDDKTIHVKIHDKDRVKEEKIEATTVTTEDFVPVEEELKGVRVLSDHIAKVIELNPNSKKRLTKRERKTVDKIVEKKRIKNN